MRTRTLTNLTADVRFYSGLGSSQAVTDAQIMRLLNESVVQSASLLSGLSDERYLSKSVTSTLTAGSTSVSFGTDCFKPERVSWVDADGQEYPIRRASADEYANIDTIAAGWDDREPVFFFMGDHIEIYPKCTSNKTIKIYYQSYLMGCYNTGGNAIQEFTTGTDYLDGRLGLDDWVVMNASIKVRVAQELDIKDLAFLKVDLQQAIIKSLANRAPDSPRRLPRSKYIDLTYKIY